MVAIWGLSVVSFAIARMSRAVHSLVLAWVTLGDGMKLPKYALKGVASRTVQILCRGNCGMGRYAEVTDPNYSKINGNPPIGTFAKCLKCGYIASDPYNWDCK